MAVMLWPRRASLASLHLRDMTRRSSRGGGNDDDGCARVKSRVDSLIGWGREDGETASGGGGGGADGGRGEIGRPN
jgi:hypothetical protein